MIREHYLLIIVLLGAIAASLWLQQARQPIDLALGVEQPTDTGYDHFIDGAYWTNWNREGQVEQNLNAIRLEHFPSRQGSVLSSPKLHTTKNHDPYWTIVANRAWLPDTGPILQLDTHVIASMRSSSGAKRILQTELMLVDTRQNHAFSDLPVRIESISGIVTGTGFHADLDSHRMELHDQVRSLHEDNQD